MTTSPWLSIPMGLVGLTLLVYLLLQSDPEEERTKEGAP